MYQNYITDLYRKKPELLTNNDWIVEAVENIVKYFNRWAMFYGRKKEYYVSLKNDSNKQELAHKLTFKKGIFNTDDENSHSNLSRYLVEALDTIGNNNIKGVYVGCRESWKENENLEEKNIPPRLVGRLATTIVMEDGLYIG